MNTEALQVLQALAQKQQKAAVEYLEHLTKCTFLGVSQATIELHDRVVQRLATTTFFSNSFVVEMGREYLYERASRGCSTIPDPIDVPVWANELWDRMTGDLYLRQQGLPGLALMRPNQKLNWDLEAISAWEELRHK